MGATFGGANVGASLSAFANRVPSAAQRRRIRSRQLAAKLGQYALRAHDWCCRATWPRGRSCRSTSRSSRPSCAGRSPTRSWRTTASNVENAREVEEFLRDKYTNQELYGWMVGQFATVLLPDLSARLRPAKRAERAFRHELGLKDSSFIQFGYWDSLKKGLLAGERLYHDLKRMEVAYLDQNRREYEITKHVSLAPARSAGAGAAEADRRRASSRCPKRSSTSTTRATTCAASSRSASPSRASPGRTPASTAR